ncbi:acyl-CoA dehydrogenase [Sphingosinicella microcystinivorans]|uniref:Acyl-CoA dehydrogenase n=2 Tax=Sphingosinicella microcystinivorans TaxID=335406 RepID=A0AAD1G0C1_SPHMI|nr:acyl-CoA dehydrogenase family protein [Sphingosinicella microcystinivorans]RKS84970.1 acyl-CoA dehydrogenase [Sphingosinicella microcystinivorans]BBE33371.1 acyl-CoA dehydrogenase [Sphingosinicella microcystinivorans]
MNDSHQALIQDMADSLFADLAARSAGKEAKGNIWAEIEALSLHDLLVGQEAGGFGGSWKDAGVVFHAAGRHGLAIPVGETILARSWLSRMGVVLPSGPVGFILAEGMGGRQAHPHSPGDRRSLVLERRHWTLLSAEDGEIIASGRMTLDVDALHFEAALLRSCQIAGAMEGMLGLSVEHVIARVQFGKPLARLQAVQQQLAVLAEECAAVACASASACQAATYGDARFEIAAAKWRANRAAAISVDIAHQVHGAIGFTREYPLHRFSLQALKWRGEHGSEQYWAQWIGRFTLAARPIPLWHWLTARSDRLLEAEREALK